MNGSDNKLAWDAVMMLEKFLKSGSKSANRDLVEWAENKLIETKRKIRKFYKQESNRPECRYFDSKEAGYYRVFSVTDYKSVDEAEESHQPLTCYPDQIGRWYEINHKFFKRSDGKVCGYAWIAMNW